MIFHKDPYDGDKADSELVVFSPIRSYFTGTCISFWPIV